MFGVKAKIIALNVLTMCLVAWLPAEVRGQTPPQSFKLGVTADFAGNYNEAARLFRIGANKGDTASQNELGNLYLLGHGVPRDYVEAYKWFKLAARSERDRDTANYNRGRAAAHMTPNQILEAEKRSRDWRAER